MGNRLLPFLALLGLVVLSMPATPAQAQEGGSQEAAPVGTVYAELKPVADSADFVGRIEAMERVEIRARVKGYLEAVLFTEGDLVKEGQPLYRIEKGQFEAAVEQAKGLWRAARPRSRWPNCSASAPRNCSHAMPARSSRATRRSRRRPGPKARS